MRDTMEGKAIYLTDMSRCLPAEALSPEPTAHTWQVADYTAEGLSGNMVFAHALVDAPAITLPLGAQGWHAVSIGFWPGVEQEHRSLLRYRLSGEEIFTLVEHPRQSPSLPGCFWDRTEILETFPQYADLTGQDLVISQHRGAFPPALACVAYVKLRPLTPQEVSAIQRDRQQRGTRQVIAMNDGGSLFGSMCPSTREELLEEVEPYRYSDVAKVLWGASLGDRTLYRSTIGKFWAPEREVYPTAGHQHAVRSCAALAEQGVDPLAAVLEHVHAMGIEFHTYHRLSITDLTHPYCSFETDFLSRHPEWRMVSRDGTPIIKASYAFAGVRDFVTALIEEVLGRYDVDGVQLCFIRGPEYIGFEAPVLDDFRALYGEDARDAPPDDERLFRLRASYLTELVRGVRRAADRQGAGRGRRVQVSAIFEGGAANMRYFGYDAYTWVKERLLDFMITSPPYDLVELAHQNDCQVYMGPAITWLGDDAVEKAVLAMRHAWAGGVDGVALWDPNLGGQTKPEAWEVYRRLGHRADTMDLREPALYPKMKRTKITSIRGRDFAHTLNVGVPSFFYGPHPGGLPEMLTIYSGG